MYCVYCDKNVDDNQMSDEHIWPQALGGNSLPKDPWRIQVCKSCNSMCGLFVDGAFLKSFIFQMEQSNSSLEGNNIENPKRLTYLGKPNEFIAPPDHIVEFWVGPAANIFLVRKKDERWEDYAGGNPKKQIAKIARAYFFAHEKAMDATGQLNEEKMRNTLLAYKKTFPYAQKYILNPVFTHNSDYFWNEFKRETHPFPEDITLIETYPKRKGNRKLTGTIKVNQNLGKRMFAKIALGLGYNILGSKFCELPYCASLRSTMREGDLAKLMKSEVIGGRYLIDHLEMFDDILSIENAWVFLVIVVEDKLMLICATPKGKNVPTMICDDLTNFLDLADEFPQGVVWVCLEDNDEVVEPMLFPDFILYRLERNPEILDQVLKMHQNRK